ncbi:MAG: tRNA adenosine(34) deaminase TadA [Clostridia bacterium]|nr:tRNA adenosine(34) deaminase TadA [Clostridia bacterium]
MSEKDELFMAEAIKEAIKAKEAGEVPVGAVIVKNGTVIAGGHNRRETEKNALYHAEIEAIDHACKVLGGWRLPGCSLYVTLEPCPMCAGAIINSRIERVVYGCKDTKAGSIESIISINDYPYNHKFDFTSGILEEECSSLLTDFFTELRNQRKCKSEDLPVDTE